MYRIGIDLGGTNIAAGLVDEQMRIIDRETVKTVLPTSLDKILDKLTYLVDCLMARNHLEKEHLSGIGVGVPCTANTETGCMEDADHLGFPGGPLATVLESRTHIPVKICNDANAAAWGEYRTGNYPSDSFILVTLGTGIGGGIILNGRLLEGVNYAAGELGHMVIHSGGVACGCGRRGCFEAYGSASALIAQAKARMSASETCLRNVSQIDAKSVFSGAGAGDMVCLELLDAYTTCLAEGFANIINIFQPAVLCIGGGVSAAGDTLLDPVREKTGARIFTPRSGRNTEIILARLGNDAGIIGAAMLGI